MTVTSVAGDSFPPFYIGTNLASITEDSEAWVLPVSRLRSTKTSTLTQHGTSHAVATHVENFPFPPLDNRRHEQRSPTTAPAPSPIPNTSYRTSPSNDANLNSKFELDEPFDLNFYKRPLASCRGNSAKSPLQHSAATKHHASHRSALLTTPHHPTSSPTVPHAHTTSNNTMAQSNNKDDHHASHPIVKKTSGSRCYPTRAPQCRPA